ncbi:MAG: hypothetical protein M3R52_10360, partial [Acidobacteriota bacterium]|nr:hypothetical protein [Acidobacteriota bacterium]
RSTISPKASASPVNARSTICSSLVAAPILSNPARSSFALGFLARALARALRLIALDVIPASSVYIKSEHLPVFGRPLRVICQNWGPRKTIANPV